MDVNIKKAFRVIGSQKDNLYVNLKGSLLESKANNDVAVYMLVPTSNFTHLRSKHFFPVSMFIIKTKLIQHCKVNTSPMFANRTTLNVRLREQRTMLD